MSHPTDRRSSVPSWMTAFAMMGLAFLVGGGCGGTAGYLTGQVFEENARKDGERKAAARYKAQIEDLEAQVKALQAR